VPYTPEGTAMILDIHETPEGAFSKPGFNQWDGDEEFTSFRLIYKSEGTSWYFRIRNLIQPKYIFEWD
jgi:hypothetical protein